MGWMNIDEVALQGKTGEYIVPGPTVKGMPKKRRSRGMAKPKKGGYEPKPVDEPVSQGPKSQKQIRDYPEYANELDVKAINIMGLSTKPTKLRIPYYDVSKNRRFIKGVDWALEKLAVPPKQELARQEKNEGANLARYKGARVTDVARINKHAPMTMVRVKSPLHIVLDKMHDIALKKSGGNARALTQSGDPFWYGVFRLGEVLSMGAPWNAMSDWQAQEAIRLWQKYAGLELKPDGKLRLPWGPKTEANGETYHGKDGKFTKSHRAHTVTRGGERFKPVRQLRRIKGAKTRSKKKKEENVVSAVEPARELSNFERWRRLAELRSRPLQGSM